MSLLRYWYLVWKFLAVFLGFTHCFNFDKFHSTILVKKLLCLTGFSPFFSFFSSSHSKRAGTAIAMKRGTVKKAKDTRLLITYSTVTCLYCVIIQKKTCTWLLHHTKHTKHHDKMALLSRIKNLNKRTETTGSCYFLLVHQNLWFIGDQDPCQLYSARIRVIFIIYTIGPQNEVIVILMRVLNEGDDYEIECCCLIKDLRVVVQSRLVPMFIFQC